MSITRANLRTRARALADQDSAGFPTDTQYNIWLDDGKREVWYALVMAGWPVQYTTQTIPANGSAQYTIASGAAILGVQAVYYSSGGIRTEVTRLDPSDKAGVLSLAGQEIAAGYEVRNDPASGVVLRLFPA
jgi:hypothetical protein